MPRNIHIWQRICRRRTTRAALRFADKKDARIRGTHAIGSNPRSSWRRFSNPSNLLNGNGKTMLSEPSVNNEKSKRKFNRRRCVFGIPQSSERAVRLARESQAHARGERK